MALAILCVVAIIVMGVQALLLLRKHNLPVIHTPAVDIQVVMDLMHQQQLTQLETFARLVESTTNAVAGTLTAPYTRANNADTGMSAPTPWYAHEPGSGEADEDPLDVFLQRQGGPGGAVLADGDEPEDADWTGLGIVRPS
jgi:hypothetical protein